MSKMTKLINNPKQFFWDVRPVRMVRSALPFEITMIDNNHRKPMSKSKSFNKKENQNKVLDKRKNQLDKKKSYNNSLDSKSSLTSIIHDVPVSNIDLSHCQIALYFSGDMGSIYQIEQWFGPLEVLHKKSTIVIVTRIKAVYEWLTYNTEFIIVYCRTIQDLTNLYEESNFKCILYVNHGFKNFQSLMNHRALHIHINHGESDKTSTITNQAKSYDYVYVVAQAGYDKYNNNLIKKDMSNFIKIGRPQLEHVENLDKFQTDKTVVLYAPTWEGTHDSMNFSSLQEYGLSMVQQLLNDSNYFVVYKPHPNTGSRDSKIKKINEAIISMLAESESAEVISSGNINSLYSNVDICIFDNSAVAIDYLKVDKPMIMTDTFHRIKGRSDIPIITGAARMIKPLDGLTITNIIKEELESDTKKTARQKIKQYFLGDFDYDNSESTATFVRQILDACNERDILLESVVINKCNSSN